jgi:glutamate-1-semialdehyde aminotransferase
MGIGTNILGYGHPEVDEVVMKTVRDGNMSTLNSPEEVNLAEKLIEMHPWSSSVRFARSGGEANAIAIRIARSASGRDNVAICGYHGWHDWYLSANLNNNKSLDGHLLSGLEPNGVPKNLKETVFPFKYNEIDELKKIVKEKNIGIIKMEVYRNIEPKDNFLKKVREIATDNKIILIFDECTSGFRETFGGIHKKYSVDPDMAMFGKALGNGYAITAVLGRKKLWMRHNQVLLAVLFGLKELVQVLH